MSLVKGAAGRVVEMIRELRRRELRAAVAVRPDSFGSVPIAGLLGMSGIARDWNCGHQQKDRQQLMGPVHGLRRDLGKSGSVVLEHRIVGNLTAALRSFVAWSVAITLWRLDSFIELRINGRLVKTRRILRFAAAYQDRAI